MPTTIAIHLGCSGRDQMAMVAGLRAYCRTQALDWDLHLLGRAGAGNQPPVMDAAVVLAGGQGTAAVMALLQTLPTGTPVVHISPINRWPAYPVAARIGIDDRHLAAVAARHLRDAGYRSAAVIGTFARNSPRQRRGPALLAAGKGLGMEVWHYCEPQPERSFTPSEHDQRVAEWLAGLPAPVGVFCVNDRAAVYLRQLCRHHGLGVPVPIGILGVDDDLELCEAAPPPLSSIILPFHQLGEQAALALHRCLSGREPETAEVLVPPVRVAARASTALIQKATGLTGRTVRLLRRRLAQPPTQAEMAAALGVSHDTIARTVRRDLGMSPKALQLRLRLAEARRLVAETTQPLGRIAKKCGWASTPAFNHAFAAACGMPPGRFRRLAQ